MDDLIARLRATAGTGPFAQLPLSRLLIEGADALAAARAEARQAEQERDKQRDENDKWNRAVEALVRDVSRAHGGEVSTPSIAPTIAALCADRLRLEAEVAALRAALTEALEGWEYAAQYKGEYFIKKHGDADDITRLRALLTPAPARAETE